MMNPQKALQSRNLNFDFLMNSQYKIFCSVIKSEKYQEELRQIRENSIKTSDLPAFIKLRDCRNVFYNSIYSIKHLYEQNKQKIERTCQKLKAECEKCDELLQNYSKLFVGTWSLLYIEFVMNKYLRFSLAYEEYLDKVASFSDRYSTYTDVLSYYLSLTNVFEKLTEEYYSMLESLKEHTSKAFGKANAISSHLLDVINNLNKYEAELNDMTNQSNIINDMIINLQRSGYNCSFKSVKSKYYIESLLQDIVDEGMDKSIKNQPLHLQLNVIRNKIVLLRLLVSKFKI